MSTTSRLLWINKSTDSSSLISNENESWLIRKHVQSLRKPGKSKHVVFSRGEALSWRTKPSVQDPARSTRSSPELQVDNPMTTPIYRQTIVPSRGSLEPFDCFAIPVEANVLTHFHYFEEVWSSSAFQSPLYFAQATTESNADVVARVRETLTDQVHIYSLLAATSGRMKAVSADPLDHIDTAYFATKVLRALCLYIAKGGQMNQNHVLDILFLAAYEIYASNLDGAKAHLRVSKLSSKPLVAQTV